VLLQINGARPDDTGTYVLVAKNPLGRDQTEAPVDVSFGPAIDTNGLNYLFQFLFSRKVFFF
jgi:hypothetical protein